MLAATGTSLENDPQLMPVQRELLGAPVATANVWDRFGAQDRRARVSGPGPGSAAATHDPRGKTPGATIRTRAREQALPRFFQIDLAHEKGAGGRRAKSRLQAYEHFHAHSGGATALFSLSPLHSSLLSRTSSPSPPTLSWELGERSGRVIIRQGKGNKARVVPLNALASQALVEYIAPRLNCKPNVKAVVCTWPRRSSGDPPVPLWQNQKKGTLTTSAMRQMIDILVRDTAARGLVPAQTSAHTLRHTFARNYLAEHPGDIVGLASLLGHTSLDTTRIYGQPTLKQLSTRVEQLPQNAYTS